MKELQKVVAAAYGMHLADQAALVSVPLFAALVFDASPGEIGILVACQSLAQLLGSMPFGLVVDRFASRKVAVGSTLISILGFSGAWLSVVTANLVLFGLTITTAGFGIVLFVLVALSMIPRMVNQNVMAKANSKVEIPRSIMSFAVPLTIGATITSGNSRWVLAAAVLGACWACVVASRFPNIAPGRSAAGGQLSRIREGWRFVAAEAHLRAITLCALTWNFAFAVLLVTMLPFLQELRMDPGGFGVALASFGLAAILGSWLVGKLASRIAPKVVLLIGPGSSALAAVAVLSATRTGTVISIYAGFFVLGLGPSMWLVAQNTVRQLVTPPEMLGRVNATIQTAIYGIRPIGAVAGGAIVGATSPTVGLLAVIAAFGLSTIIAFTTKLRTVNTYQQLTAG